MGLREKFLRRYANADGVAHLVLSTCVAAVISFMDILSQAVAAARLARTYAVEGFQVTVCSFGPPAPYYTRLMVLGALLIATPAAFKSTVSCRFVSSVGLATALATYIYAWIESNRMFRNFVEADIHFLNHPEIKQFAYLYGGTPFDLAVALSIAVCLVLMLDRLFDGERSARNVTFDS